MREPRALAYGAILAHFPRGNSETAKFDRGWARFLKARNHTSHLLKILRNSDSDSRSMIAGNPNTRNAPRTKPSKTNSIFLFSRSFMNTLMSCD
jgi:hypothetical protein